MNACTKLRTIVRTCFCSRQSGRWDICVACRLANHIKCHYDNAERRSDKMALRMYVSVSECICMFVQLVDTSVNAAVTDTQICTNEKSTRIICAHDVRD